MPILKKISTVVFSGSVLESLFFIGALIAVLWAVYFSAATISMPYPVEFREGTALITTDLLLNGINPYELANQPLGLNVYGVGYSLTVLPFAFLFGNSLQLHRAITFVFILLSAAAGFFAVYREKKNISLALACAALIMSGLISYGGIGAFPAAMGTFLFLTALLFPFIRAFDRTSLAVSVVAALFAFYTKPYFVLAFGVVAVYLFLFVSKKKAFFYGGLFLALFAAFFALIRVAFPAYFFNIIIANIFLSDRTLETLTINLGQAVLYFYPLLALAAVVLIKSFFAQKNLPPFKDDLKFPFDFYHWDAPFLSRRVDYYFYLFACSLLAFLLILGPHGGGTGMNYVTQLLTPLLFIWLFQKINLDNKFRIVIVLIVLFNLFSWEQKTLAPAMLEQRNSKEWAEIFGYIESSTHFLNSPFTASKAVEMGLEVTDSGQTILFYRVLPYPDYAFMGPSYKSIRARGSRYSRAITRALEEQKFDLVIISKERSVFFDLNALYENYSFVKDISLEMPQTGQVWIAQVWQRPSPK